MPAATFWTATWTCSSTSKALHDIHRTMSRHAAFILQDGGLATKHMATRIVTSRSTNKRHAGEPFLMNTWRFCQNTFWPYWYHGLAGKGNRYRTQSHCYIFYSLLNIFLKSRWAVTPNHQCDSPSESLLQQKWLQLFYQLIHPSSPIRFRSSYSANTDPRHTALPYTACQRPPCY